MVDGVDSVAPPVDGFDRDSFLQGPSPYVLANEDALEVDSLCSITGVTLKISGVMLGSDLRLKPFVFFHTPNSNRTLATSRFQIGSGWILRARVIASAGAPLVGQAFAWLRLCRGITGVAEVNGTIVSGYVTATKDVFFPGAQPTNPLDEEGAPLSITIGNPAAGVDWSQTVPTGARWVISAASALLTTAVAAATRLPRLIVDDGTTTLFEVPAAASQAASLAQLYTYGAGAGGPIVTDTAVIEGPLTNDLILPAGFRIRSATAAIQAADQWSNVRLLVREWLEGN